MKKTRSRNLATKIYYSICVLAWTALGMIGSQFIIGLPLQLILGERMQEASWTFIYYALTYLLALLLAVGVPLLVYNLLQSKKKLQDQIARELLFTDKQELGLDKWPTFVDIGLAPIAYVVYLVIASAMTNLMTIFPWFNANEAQDVGFGPILYGSSKFIAMLALVFIAPFAEEVIMRGWLYGKLREKLKMPIAMLLVAVLFGVLHGQWNVAITTGVLSIVLCGLREITGSIWSGIILHVIVNGIAFYVRYVAGLA